MVTEYSFAVGDANQVRIPWLQLVVSTKISFGGTGGAVFEKQVV